MANPLPQNPSSQLPDDRLAAKLADDKVQASTAPTPLRCFTGAMIAGGIATLLYSFTQSIIQVFAHKPLPTGNPATTNIAVAVRTLVMGMSTLATAIFAISAVGLLALGIQLLIQQFRRPAN
ncbi:MAG: DUF3082 domain-containing protein [Leptolyngbyaceae cyanobacterium CRU_2_3]|nr:DUF3082 domain-containing protein [Leptolyngbyaceae cyanobacterium CRU_2_3]